ncbi:hypothetical protein [Streptomyces radicis]|uniref:TPM domain-containing protein n=1 Tax=Streptomyces radicis TaxID=1750517 RepID=A0A3A9W7G2_9ACTN|nr:hypothetical protein [Streptomyces radicis]RKN09078.1 hypothetical protein D7319_14215 [Streptomyces radicis]RKN22731.1 hypothetical protein D7318_14340 [Streptomyces radicis]
MRDAHDAGPVAAAGTDGWVALLLPLTLLGAAALVALYLLVRMLLPLPTRGERDRGRTAVRGWGGRASPRARRGDDTPPDELDTRARGLLIRLDDAVLRRLDEVVFAGAADGQRATVEARAEADATLRLRHRLDDPSIERNDPERRRLLREIIDRCSRALARLEAEPGPAAGAEAPPGVTPGALARARERAEELAARLDAADTALRTLAERYAPEAVAPVRGNPVTGRERLTEARRLLAEAGRDEERAAEALRAAEVAMGRAEALADGVARRATELARADKALAEALRATEADVADAPALPTLRTPVERARRALDAVRAGQGRRDPFGGLRTLARAGTPLAGALAPDQPPMRGDRRARTLLDNALLTAGGELAAARDYVATHRGEVGSPARTRLAEAGHQLDRALGVAPHDTDAALPHAWRADALARRARVLAARDAGAAT